MTFTFHVGLLVLLPTPCSNLEGQCATEASFVLTTLRQRASVVLQLALTKHGSNGMSIKCVPTQFAYLTITMSITRTSHRSSWLIASFSEKILFK